VKKAKHFHTFDRSQEILSNLGENGTLSIFVSSFSLYFRLLFFGRQRYHQLSDLLQKNTPSIFVLDEFLPDLLAKNSQKKSPEFQPAEIHPLTFWAFRPLFGRSLCPGPDAFVRHHPGGSRLVTCLSDG